MKILVVIDVQNDFITGVLRNEEAIKKVPNIVEEIKNFDGDIIIATMDTHDENYLETKEGQRLKVPHCIKYTEGWQIEPTVLEALKEKASEIMKRSIDLNFKEDSEIEGGLRIVAKDTFGFNGWLETFNELIDLEKYQGLDQLEIKVIGFDIEYCVITNVFGIKSVVPNANIMVKRSCVAGADEVAAQKALDVMATCHIDII